MTRPPPRSTLFPYTTLFRSTKNPERGVLGVATKAGAIDILYIGLPERDARVPAGLAACLRDAHCRSRHYGGAQRSEEHTSELQSRSDLVCRLLLEKKKTVKYTSGILTDHNKTYKIMKQEHRQ